MHSVITRSLLPLAMSAAVLVGGCATRDSVEQALAAANAAQTTAQAARMTADQALTAAQAAQQQVAGAP